MPRFDNEGFNPNRRIDNDKRDRTVPTDENYYGTSVDLNFNSKQKGDETNPYPYGTDGYNTQSGNGYRRYMTDKHKMNITDTIHTTASRSAGNQGKIKAHRDRKGAKLRKANRRNAQKSAKSTRQVQFLRQLSQLFLLLLS